MKLFDLHCDTAYEIYKANSDLYKNSFHVDLERASVYEDYRQIMAVWSDKNSSDEECFAQFFKIADHLKKHTSLFPNNQSFFLSVEDARLLCGRLERLNDIFEAGVRFLIPVWGGENILGGAFDTSIGLTKFGKDVIHRCFELGIVPDISHSSVESANDIFNIAEIHNKPVIASHSCSFSVYDHQRNLHDDQFYRIKDIGGVVGMNFCRYHLTEAEKQCTVRNILLHIEHFLNLGGENVICIGADMDGAPMPDGISGIEDVHVIYENLCDSFGKTIADKVTFGNANNFINNNLINER
ncbi:MAG: membrane dipeptidase [Clostridia bacterium]|nr:membrane dipeptidase [Clostridia bacterium]